LTVCAIEPFFLDVAGGSRFCLLHLARQPRRAGVLFVHAFAEEMNKSRRMAALQARAFARRGYNVLQIDLLGCGDSSGDFGEARWTLWKEDVRLARHWLRERAAGPVHLWGLRLGASLAADCARENEASFASLLMWQPVVSGAQFMAQLLRLRVTSEMLAGAAAGNGTGQLRAQLAGGRALEIAGYELSPELALAIERLELALLAPKSVPARWFEVNADGKPSPALRRASQAWSSAGAEVDLGAVRGEPFWNSLEISECPELIAATLDALALTPA
jgi:exosortase A-associated hydrolase 2